MRRRCVTAPVAFHLQPFLVEAAHLRATFPSAAFQTAPFSVDDVDVAARALLSSFVSRRDRHRALQNWLSTSVGADRTP